MAPKKILLLTNSEFGEANIYLATCHALIQADPTVEIHFASFNAVKNLVSTVNEYAHRTAPQAQPVVFHEIQGLPMTEALLRESPDSSRGVYLPASFGLTPGFWNTPKALVDMNRLIMAWSGPQLVGVYLSVVKIIREVQPDITAVDSVFSAGTTACRNLSLRYVVLSPNTIKDFAVGLQPRGAIFWKYPCSASGLPFPLPWHLVPLNVYYLIRAVISYIFDDRRKKTEKYFSEQTGAKLLTLADLALNPASTLDVKILVSISPELDFPFQIPSHIVPCGLIVRPAPSVSEVDPELGTWLARGPTVYINLGTHATATEDDAVEMAMALQILLDTSASAADLRNIQVLWKLKKRGDFATDKPGCRLHQILGKEMERDRVRIVSWVTAEPIAVLETGNIICSVHHGGANSFSEAVCTGVPQVVLPQWSDCYDFAHRAEYLGIGRWGSRTMRPKWAASELGPVLLDVIMGDGAEAMREKARSLSKACREGGRGRDAAAKFLLDALD